MNRADAISWVQQATTYPKFFFDDAATGSWIAAVGASSTYVSSAKDLDTIERELTEFTVDKPRVVGGIGFDTARERSPEWAAFGSAYFFEPETVYDGVDHARPMNAASIGATAIADPDDSWRELFSTAQIALQSGQLEKVVLARRTELEDPIDPWLRLGRLPHAITFCFQPDTDHVFWGTTPETLFQKTGKTVRCDALAGTRARGMSAEEDRQLRAALLESEKDRAEHDIVVRYLQESLAPFSTEIEVGETGVRTLASLQHLFTPVKAELTSQDVSILSAIHPTPALCGMPRDRSLAWLAEYEPFDRGWYGGAIGWLTPDDANMAVAIRSALRCGETTFVYAGAGIIEASQCDEEWREISAKGRTIETALGATEKAHR